MKLAIYTLKNVLFEGEVEKIIARTPTGEITILDNHIPLISSLTKPQLEVVTKDGEKNTIKIASGFLEVRPGNTVIILVVSEFLNSDTSPL